MHNDGDANEKPDVLVSLTPEAKLALEKLQAYYRENFKTQNEFAIALDLENGQSKVSRWLSGKIGLPCRIAKKIQDLTNGALTIEDLYVDRFVKR